ncbi:alcohol acetyltransferase [Echria macrotheca]|uniref:Alcohol acetyltransferase n=1 Tax=Echria macrotheca TaxID=438768 RepID=A0AAJ0B1A5_9PEZI|nr:alcohol acetyltransferase [Echria macrotheca]
MLHHLGYLFGVIVTCRYIIPEKLANNPDSPNLKRVFDVAVAQTVLEHPLLRVGLVREGSKSPSWVELQQLDLSKHIQWHDGEAGRDSDVICREVIPNHLDRRFDSVENKPGWRIMVLHNCDDHELEVIFAWNHANIDGISGKVFHESLFRNLNAWEQCSDFPSLKGRILSLPALNGSDIFPPPQEQTAKYTITPRYFVSSAWKELGPSVLSAATATWANWAPMKTSPYGTSVRCLSVGSNDGLRKILVACREHGTTLTGLVHAIIFASLASHLYSEAGPGFAGATALDMRRFSSTGTEATMGNYVSDVKHCFGENETAELRKALQTHSPTDCSNVALWALLWRIAKRVRGEIQAKLSRGTRDDVIGLMRFVRDWRQTITRQTRKPRSISWNLSNIGIMNVDNEVPLTSGQDAMWTCNRAMFVLGGEVTGAAFNVGIISVQGKGLEIAVSWQTCAVDEGIGEQLLTSMNSWMKGLVEA